MTASDGHSTRHRPASDEAGGARATADADNRRRHGRRAGDRERCPAGLKTVRDRFSLSALVHDPGRGVVVSVDRPSPVPGLRAFLSTESPDPAPRSVVVLQASRGRFGAVVHRPSGRAPSAIKPPGRLLRNHRGVSGSAILGDGEAAFIPDVGVRRATARAVARVGIHDHTARP